MIHYFVDHPPPPPHPSSSQSPPSPQPLHFFPLLVPKCEPPDHHQLLMDADAVHPPPPPFWYAERDSGIESAESAQKHSPSDWMMAEDVKEEEEEGEDGGETVTAPGQQQKCAVCGDAATGFHYAVSSCNGCKTFFRRTIMTGRVFMCKRGGNCQFDRNGRCACRACRFRRCVAAGMDEKAIQHTPSANLTLSIARKRLQRLQSVMRRDTNALSVPPELVHGFEGGELLELIGNTLRLEEKLNRLRQSAFFPMEPDLRIGQAVDRPSAFGQCDKWPIVQKWPPRPDPEVPHTDYPKLGVKFWLYMDLYLGMEYLKTMDVFRHLCRAEKIALIKNVVVPNQLLTAAHFSHQIRSDVIQYPDGWTPFQYKADNLIPLERKIVRGAVPAIQSLRPDQVQIALLRAILLLDEHCDGLLPQSRHRIGQVRSKMCRVLMVYLQNRHGLGEGLRLFADSMHFVSALFRRQQVQKSYFIYRHYILHNSAQIPLFWDFMDELREKEEKTEEKQKEEETMMERE